MRASPRRMPDEIFECVVPYITDPRDRAACSQVCRRWHQIDGWTRKHVTIALCYTTTPQRLLERFPSIESLKLKGKPRAAMFNLIPENWGGYVEPWVNVLEEFRCLNSLHFRRMIVSDADLENIANAKGPVLKSLKLDKCSGFSTDGLLHISRSCRNLRTLFLEESIINEINGEWLHQLALNNLVLETINFYMTWLEQIRVEHLELLAANCPLVSVKIGDTDFSKLSNFFHLARTLEEFCGGSFGELDYPYADLRFPTRLSSLGPMYLSSDDLPMVFPVAPSLRKLDLVYADLDTEGHCRLIRECPNLEVLETRNVIGDQGLETVSCVCKKLRRLRIERGEDGAGVGDETGAVTQRGLIALSRGCLELEYLAVYVSDITNEALAVMGSNLKSLCDFRLVLLDKEAVITDLPLDNGVRALLSGCQNLVRFALYLRQGGLTDTGLGYIGQFSQNVRWMLLGYVGMSDPGLLEFSNGCPNLVKLEMRGCNFTERGLALAAIQLRSLRYLWVQGYRASEAGFYDLLTLPHPPWNIELIPGTPNENDAQPVSLENLAHILAYCSLAGRRDDFPDTGVYPWPLPVQEE